MNKEKKYCSYIKRVHKNSIYLGLLGFCMQFGSTIVHTTGDIATGHFFSSNSIFIIRNISDANSQMMKVVSGYLSDITYDRKRFLYIGYGSILVLKVCFWLTTFSFPGVAILFTVTHIIDRMCNALRDAPRDSLIIDSVNKEEDKSLNFGIRKAIAGMGTVIGGIVTYFILNSNLNFKIIYLLPLLPISIGVAILHKTVKNIMVKPSDYKAMNINFQKIFEGVSMNLILILMQVKISAIDASYALNEIMLLIFNSILFSLNFGKLNLYNLILSNCFSLFSFIFILILTQNIMIANITSMVFSILFSYILKSPVVKIIADYPKNVKKFLLVILIFILISTCKFNESFFFKRAVTLGLSKKLFPLFYGFMFLCSSFFSLASSVFLQCNRSRIIFLGGSILGLCITNFLFAGIFSFISPVCSFILAMVTWGFYNAGLDITIPPLIASCIPENENIRGTVFGIFFTFTGVVDIIMRFFCITMFQKLTITEFGLTGLLPMLSLFVLPFLYMKFVKKC